MTDTDEKAMRPEDITRLFVERSNAGDADGIAALYEEDAVMAYPPGGETVGRAAIRALWETGARRPPAFRAGGSAAHPGQRRPRAHLDRRRDGTGVRVQVARRQPDGSWLRVLDRPELP